VTLQDVTPARSDWTEPMTAYDPSDGVIAAISLREIAGANP
jgi:hypothetical protein